LIGGVWGFFRHFSTPKISPWQGGKDPLKSALPGVLAIAGTSVFASKNPMT
jgi:hypothetical protein